MQVVAWSDWLDRHIPYYEKTKQINRYADNPPEAILVVDPVDRNRRVAPCWICLVNLGSHGQLNQRFKLSGRTCVPGHRHTSTLVLGFLESK
jgi:tRNA nucleotidyltransferase (CCA-adding enzyme)